MRTFLMVLLLAAGAVVAGAVTAGAVQASPEGERVPDVLKIEGMEPISAADLTRFTGLAVRLAAASKSDPRVEPMLTETLAQIDRGIVKRAVAYLALCAMHEEDVARRLTTVNFRDRAVLKLVHACLADQQTLSTLPPQ